MKRLDTHTNISVNICSCEKIHTFVKCNLDYLFQVASFHNKIHQYPWFFYGSDSPRLAAIFQTQGADPQRCLQNLSDALSGAAFLLWKL